MFSGIGFQEILLILVIALLLFGAKRIPEIAKALGKGLVEFKDALAGKSKEEEQSKDEGRGTKDEKPKTED
jgi:sec-independent protein translocase protein TatA